MANAKLSISHLADEKQRVESFDVNGKFQGTISVIWRFESSSKPETTTTISTEDVIGNFQFTGNSSDTPIHLNSVVVSASNLKPRAGGAGRTTVVHISYDDQKYQSTVSPLSLSPQWDFSTVLYVPVFSTNFFSFLSSNSSSRVRNLSSSLLIRLVDQDTVKRTHLVFISIVGIVFIR